MSPAKKAAKKAPAKKAAKKKAPAKKAPAKKAPAKKGSGQEGGGQEEGAGQEGRGQRKAPAKPRRRPRRRRPREGSGRSAQAPAKRRLRPRGPQRRSSDPAARRVESHCEGSARAPRWRRPCRRAACPPVRPWDDAMDAICDDLAAEHAALDATRRAIAEAAWERADAGRRAGRSATRSATSGSSTAPRALALTDPDAFTASVAALLERLSAPRRSDVGRGALASTALQELLGRWRAGRVRAARRAAPARSEDPGAVVRAGDERGARSPPPA